MDELEKAMHPDDRLLVFKNSYPPLKFNPAKIHWSYHYGKFRCNYAPYLPSEIPVIFQAKDYGLHGKKFRNKLFKGFHAVPFVGYHLEIISDIITKADEIATEKTGEIVYLKLDWFDIDMKEKNAIHNISCQTCYRKDGKFDFISWVFFVNTYLEYYYHSIHKLL